MRKLIAVPAMLLLAASLLVFCSTRSIAQDKHDGRQDGRGGMHDGDKAGQDKSGQDMSGMPSKEEMEKMMAAGTPGPEHKEMMKSAGDWDAECHFMMAGQPGPAMKGTMHIEPLMDGRYMMMKYDGVMNMGMGDQPYKGMGISGFDNTTKKYFSVWLDNMSTAVMKTEGTKNGNTVTLTGKIADPTTGKEVEVKEIVTHDDDNHMSYQMFTPGPDGKLAPMMEIKYTRKM